MTRWSEQDLAQAINQNPDLRISRPTSAGNRGVAKDRRGAEKPARAPQARRNRYSEQSGELGLKVRQHMEQLGNSIRLWLPYPPSANNRLASVNGRLVKSAESRSYQKLIKDALVGLTPLSGDLKLWMTIYRPRRRGDIDNVLKNCLDALTGIAFFDDEQFAQLDVHRIDGENARKYPGLQIQITKLG